MKAIAILLALSTLGVTAKLILDAEKYSHLQAQLNTLESQLTGTRADLDRVSRDNIQLNLLNQQLQLLASEPRHSARTALQVAPTSVDQMIESVNVQQLLAQDNDEFLLRKHALLLARLAASGADIEQMKKLLAMRERVLSTSSLSAASSEQDVDVFLRTQQAALADVDARIRELLSFEDQAVFELLKDSTYEQAQLNNFLGNLPQADSITEADRQALLLVKLEQKQAFYAQLQTLSRDIHAAEKDAREGLIAQAKDLLHKFKDDYLSGARNNLSAEQYDLLREYEQQHFDEIWASLLAGF